MKLADRIRKYVLENHIHPARRMGQQKVIIHAREVHTGMKLDNRYPAVCGALDADKFLGYADVMLVERSGPHQGTSAEWVFGLS